MKISTGLDRFLATEYKRFRGVKLGVLCNQASVDARLRHISECLLDPKLKLDIACWLGPQHGIRGEKQDNMVESSDFLDERTKRPVFSLYSKTRVPTFEMLRHFDVLLIDLQDIGTRIYTFMYTMANCMRAAKTNGKKIVVLDRPNPIGGEILEGNVLDLKFASFVGQYPMPVRHAMTMGELSKLFNERFDIGCDLEVIELKGWKREKMADTWEGDWIPPSPNIPTWKSSLVFPATVYFEGTNVSEGRGTTMPFEWIGAPYIDPDAFSERMNAQKLPGIYFRPIYFQPTYQKWKDTICGGVQLHVTDAVKFRPFTAGIRMLADIAAHYPGAFEWKKPPYEYEFEKQPIDLIAGTDMLRMMVDHRKPIAEFEQRAKDDSVAYKKIWKTYLLY